MQQPLKHRFENIANEYLNIFTEKQEIEFDFWVGDEIGGLASFNTEHFFTLDDMRIDIDHDAPKGLIIQWHYDNLDAGRDNWINYPSYIKGLRHADLATKQP